MTDFSDDLGEPWLSDEQQCAWRTWLAVEALLPMALHRALQEDAGLSLSDFVVLVRLSESEDGRVRVSDLARALTWEKSRTSHHLTRMERRGLVGRRSCPTDGRGSFVTLTDRGRSALEQAAPGHARTVRSVLFDHLSQAELATLAEILGRVRDRLECPEESGVATSPGRAP